MSLFSCLWVAIGCVSSMSPHTALVISHCTYTASGRSGHRACDVCWVRSGTPQPACILRRRHAVRVRRSREEAAGVSKQWQAHLCIQGYLLPVKRLVLFIRFVCLVADRRRLLRAPAWHRELLRAPRLTSGCGASPA